MIDKKKVITVLQLVMGAILGYTAGYMGAQLLRLYIGGGM